MTHRSGARRRTRVVGLWLVALALSLSLATPHVARAQTAGDEPVAPQAHRLHWNDEWPKFRPIGYALTAASVIGALSVTLFIDYPDDPRWSGGILFDNAVRDGLRARSPGLRDGIRIASDITLAATLINVILVDGLAVPLADRSPDVAWQLSLMNAQALSLNILIATLLFKSVARARPSAEQCARDPGFDPMCESGSFASFPSGHTSTAFTAAGLTCAHHNYLPLYGGGVWDATACIGALSLATTTGLFRIIGDRHYATDVLMGAVLGLSLGYVYPWLFHYGEPARNTPGTSANLRWGIVPAAAPAQYGLSWAGQF